MKGNNSNKFDGSDPLMKSHEHFQSVAGKPHGRMSSNPSIGNIKNCFDLLPDEFFYVQCDVALLQGPSVFFGWSVQFLRYSNTYHRRDQ